MLSAELQILSGKQKGKAIRLAGKKKFLVGRGEDCQLRPNSDLVSRHHCVFQIDPYSLRIKDLGSTNGTLVNEERISGNVILKSGDKVTIGKLEFEVALSEIDDSAGSIESAPEMEIPAEDSAESPTTYIPEVGSQTVVDHNVDDPHQQESETTVLSGHETMSMPTYPEGQFPQQPQMPPGQYPQMPPGQYPGMPPGQYPPMQPGQQYPPGAYPPPGSYPPGAYPPPAQGYGYPPGQQSMPQGYQQNQAPYPYPVPQPGMMAPGMAPPQSAPEIPVMTEEESSDEVDVKKELPLKLPDPSETGAIEEEQKPKEKKKSGEEEASPSNTAADILRKMSRRNPGE